MIPDHQLELFIVGPENAGIRMLPELSWISPVGGGGRRVARGEMVHGLMLESQGQVIKSRLFGADFCSHGACESPQLWILTHMCNKLHHPTQNIGQPEASTDAETATLDHHPHNPAFLKGLAGSGSLLTDSVTNG